LPKLLFIRLKAVRKSSPVPSLGAAPMFTKSIAIDENLYFYIYTKKKNGL